MLNDIKHFIDKASQLKVAVIGDTITDEFIYVTYEGQSMKSICPVFKLVGKQQRQEGGAAAIANHLKDFTAKVDLFSNAPDTIVKTRYIDVSDQKKHVEINKFDIDTDKTIAVNVSDYDVVIIADFGHGVCDNVTIGDGFHLMCQTNSNNFGFNRISKWKKYKKASVCVDLREASLQMNKKASFSTDEEVAELYNYELNTGVLFVTLGSSGSLVYDGSSVERRVSFKSEIVDTIGAGDTFFAFACLVTAIYGEQSNKLLIPSLAASLSTTWLCNEHSVTKKRLLDYATKFV